MFNRQSNLLGVVTSMLCAVEAGTGANNAGANDVKVVAVNPLASPISTQVETNLVEMKKAKFSFRTSDKLDPETGQVVMTAEIKDEATGKILKKAEPVKWKRPTLELTVPVLTKAGLIAALQSDDKSTELALEQANEAIYQRARALIAAQIEANEAIELTPELIDLAKLNFLEIAMLPRGERGAGISKEEWAAFVEDYKLTMQTPEAIALFPDHKPRSMDILNTHATLLAGKFNQVKSRKDVVQKIDVFLDVWASVSKNAEEHQACFELLKAKAKAIMEGEDFNNL